MNSPAGLHGTSRFDPFRNRKCRDIRNALANRVRNLLAKRPGYDEKKMFGGVCYLLNGNMACAGF